MAVDDQAARCRTQHGAQSANGRGFTGSVGTEKSKKAAFLHLKRNPVYGRKISELFSEIIDFDHGGIHCNSSCISSYNTTINYRKYCMEG
jgi:hypothetical protein